MTRQEFLKTSGMLAATGIVAPLFTGDLLARAFVRLLVFEK